MGTVGKRIIFLAMVLVGIAVAFSFAFFQPVQKEAAVPMGATHSIVLRVDGYDPSTLTIKKGDVVDFSTNRGFQHWPASNLHPTHNMYSAFDPKMPVNKDETWSFQFIKVGVWKFHDHLNSTFTGTITVVE
jgi:plastocyanin